MRKFLFPIKDKPVYNLESHIDLAGLQKIEKDILVGFAKSKNIIVDGGAAGVNIYKSCEQQNKISLQDISWPKVIRDSNNPNYKYYEALNFDEYACRFFNRYAEDTIQLGQVLELRATYPGQYNQKHISSKCWNTPAYKHFPEFIKWIDNLKIFNQVGRIMFVLNSPYDKHVIHKDSYIGNNDNFIIINLNPTRKEFFLLDSKEQECVIDSKAFVFDTRNFHGTRGLSNYGWTVRIDGVFDRSWLKEIGLDDHFSEINLPS
jgi:hypothetical protein